MAIANARDLGAIKMNVARTIVEHDEIVARAVHFRETQHALSSSTVSAESQPSPLLAANSPLSY